MAELPPPPEGMVLTHFIVSDDVERSRRFYTEVLGGRVAFPGNPVNVALANSWIVINSGGGPTDDKPTVILETPRDPDRVSSFLNIRVKDIDAVYAEWSARGAQFLTPPKQHRYEKRCYIRDPDGHLIEVGQTTDPEGDWTPPHWPSSTPLRFRPPARGLLGRQRSRVLDADFHPGGKVVVAGEVFRADTQPAGHLPALHHGGGGPGRRHQAG
jgi:catechol 2,3-dioxygenase-like lactoylglutathione lyase family enzyme